MIQILADHHTLISLGQQSNHHLDKNKLVQKYYSFLQG
jgi:hypothetical protein